MKTLVFGSCNIDEVLSLDHIVSPGETTAASSSAVYPGGKGLNQAIALARAGSEVYFAGKYGSDGEFLIELLKSNGVEVSLAQKSKVPNGKAFIQVAKNGENSIVILHGANYDVDRQYVHNVLSHFGKGDLIVLQNEISSLNEIVSLAKLKGMTVALNPSPFDERMKELDLSDIDYLILNETEASYFAGKSDENAVIAYFKKSYPGLKVVLTLGKKGCIYFDKDKTVGVEAFSVKAVDTTAAGDTFTGYFLSSVGKGSGIARDLRFANAAAALSVSKKGAASSIPTFDEVKEALPNLRGYSKDKKELLEKKFGDYFASAGNDSSLSGAAEYLGYTVPYAARLIKNTFGHNFSYLLLDLKLSAAAKRLKETGDPVSEIISEAGYKNESFFRKAFVRKYGMAPLAYRKSDKNDK